MNHTIILKPLVPLLSILLMVFLSSCGESEAEKEARLAKIKAEEEAFLAKIEMMKSDSKQIAISCVKRKAGNHRDLEIISMKIDTTAGFEETPELWRYKFDGRYSFTGIKKNPRTGRNYFAELFMYFDIVIYNGECIEYEKQVIDPRDMAG